eukprot:Rmarinus@m.22079
MAQQTKPRCSVFVGNMPYDASESELLDIFKVAGPVVHVRIMTDHKTGKSKGYGFVEFRDPETARSALRNLNGHEYRGRRLRVDLGKQGRSDDAKFSNDAEDGRKGIKLDPLSSAIARFNREEQKELLSQMKAIVQSHPDKARDLLLGQPQLTQALLQIQMSLGYIQPPPSAPVGHGPSATSAPHSTPQAVNVQAQPSQSQHPQGAGAQSFVQPAPVPQAGSSNSVPGPRMGHAPMRAGAPIPPPEPLGPPRSMGPPGEYPVHMGPLPSHMSGPGYTGGPEPVLSQMDDRMHSSGGPSGISGAGGGAGGPGATSSGAHPGPMNAFGGGSGGGAGPGSSGALGSGGAPPRPELLQQQELLLQRVLSLTEEQVASLPEEKQNYVRNLRNAARSRANF